MHFDGAWFAGQTATSVTFELLLGSTSVWTSGTMFTSDIPTFLSSGYSGMVDNVLVLSNAPDYYVMDDVTFNGGSSSVPEPGKCGTTRDGSGWRVCSAPPLQFDVSFALISRALGSASDKAALPVVVSG